MQQTIVSTTDSAEDVLAANAEAKPIEGNVVDQVDDKTTTEEVEASASDSNETDETTDESEASDKTENTETDEDTEGDEGIAAKGKGKSGFKRRLDKLTKQKTTALQEAEYWKREALKRMNEEKQTQNTAATTQNATAQDANVKPNPDAFETHTDYVEALAEWKAEVKLREFQAKQKQEQMRAELESKQKTFVSKMKEFAKTHEDFDEGLQELLELGNVPHELDSLIMESDNGPEIIYHLSKDLDFYQSLKQMPPLIQAKELGKFEARLQKKTTSQTKTTTSAPPPIKTAQARGNIAKKDIYDEDLSFAEYKRIMNERERSQKAY